MLNVVLFGKTAKQWKDENPRMKRSIRDEAELNQLIPEVIVAKQVSYPDEPKGKLLFFDNIFRYIRSRFDEAFGRKAVSNL